MSKVAYLGCVAAVSLFAAGAANASSITLDSVLLTQTGGSSGASQTDTSDINGFVNSKSNLVYATDYIEFHVTPTSATDVNVNVLNNTHTNTPSFIGETYRITQGTVGGPVVLGPTTASNISTTVTLAGGVEYFLELNSTGVQKPIGQSDLALSVQAPLPGALLLFGSVFGAGGLLMRRRNKRAALATAQV